MMCYIADALLFSQDMHKTSLGVPICDLGRSTSSRLCYIEAIFLLFKTLIAKCVTQTDFLLL